MFLITFYRNSFCHKPLRSRATFTPLTRLVCWDCAVRVLFTSYIEPSSSHVLPPSEPREHVAVVNTCAFFCCCLFGPCALPSLVAVMVPCGWGEIEPGFRPFESGQPERPTNSPRVSVLLRSSENPATSLCTCVGFFFFFFTHAVVLPSHCLCFQPRGYWHAIRY